MERKELIGLLERNGIDVLLYGKGEAKSLDDLLNEINDPSEGVRLAAINDKEFKLRYGTELLRIVDVLNIHVLYDNGNEKLRLREALQIFNDGRFRARLDRLAAVSEKLHSDEEFLEGIARAIAEELGLDEIDMSQTTSIDRRQVIKVSQSFPGLVSEYTIHHVMYCMEEKFFNPEGYVETQKDKKRILFGKKHEDVYKDRVIDLSFLIANMSFF